MTRKSNHRAKHGGGSYAPLTRFMLRSESFASLSAHGTKLLLDFVSLYNGFNNGDLSFPWSFAVQRKWKSRDTLNKALKELLDGGWIVKTRQGGLHKCSLYGLTFFSLDDVRDKSGASKFDPGITATTSPPGGWYRDPAKAVITGIPAKTST